MTRQNCIVACTTAADNSGGSWGNDTPDVSRKPIVREQFQLTEAAKSNAIDQQHIWSRVSGLEDTVDELRNKLDGLQDELDQ